MPCECQNWARDNIVLLTEHHPRCCFYNAENEAWKVINSLLKGIMCWGADEDGIHADCWDAFKQGAYFIGKPELIKDEEKI